MDLVLSNKELCVLCSFQLVIGIIHFGTENSYKYILVPEPPLGLGQPKGGGFGPILVLSQSIHTHSN